METKKEAAKNGKSSAIRLNINCKPHSKDHMDHEEVVQDQDNEDLPFVCPVCNSKFKSESALRAHKRTHNNFNNNKKNKKSKKLVFGHTNSNPPHHQLNTSSSISSTRDHHDSSATNTQKRRRSSSNSLKTSTPPPAGDLVLDLEKSLKQSNVNYWSVKAKRGSGKSISSSSSSGGTKEQESSGDEEGYYIIKRENNKNENNIKKPRRKNMKFVILEEEGEERQGQYLCSECKTSYTSYQALSDQRSSHKMKNIVIKNHLSSADHDYLSRYADEKATDDRHKDDDDDGGEDQVSDERGGSKYVLDFDLNELPPADSEG